jgi:hypothetical protein
MMGIKRPFLLSFWVALFAVALWGAAVRAEPQSPFVAYLPIIFGPPLPICGNTTGQTYSQGPAFQFDQDNPVRPAWNHADKNIDLRGYDLHPDPSQKKELVDYGSGDPTQPPQLATLFSPHKVPPITNLYRINGWNWAPSPTPGTRGTPVTFPSVTAVGWATTVGEFIHTPTSGYDIGGGMEVIVIFADENSVTLRYTREDSGGSPGYTVHIDQICTDAALLALYNALDNPAGPRYQFPSSGYNLPQLPAGQPLGYAKGSEVVVAIVDSGMFWDPRSCNEWWQIRPGYGGSCPPP